MRDPGLYPELRNTVRCITGDSCLNLNKDCVTDNYMVSTFKVFKCDHLLWFHSRKPLILEVFGNKDHDSWDSFSNNARKYMHTKCMHLHMHMCMHTHTYSGREIDNIEVLTY